MALLARREHSAYELKQKLKLREFDNDGIDAAIESLQKDQLQSDNRFTESYVNHRISAGYGPIKISLELGRRRVSDELVEECLLRLNIQWDKSMKQQRIKKFGQEIPADYSQRMKQARFLQNRGFSPDSVMRLFR